MNLTQARDLAKEAWRHPRNAKEAIQPNLLESFAEILEREVNKAREGCIPVSCLNPVPPPYPDERAHNFTGLP